jgi:hypothetical protein
MDVHLNMQTGGFFEMLAPISEAIRRHIPPDHVNVNVIYKMICVRTPEVPCLEGAQGHGNKILYILSFDITCKSAAGKFNLIHIFGD